MRAPISEPIGTAPAGLRGGAARLAGSAGLGSPAPCKVVPFQVRHLLCRQIRMGNYEFLQGLSLFLKGSKGKQRHIKIIIRAARTDGIAARSS